MIMRPTFLVFAAFIFPRDKEQERKRRNCNLNFHYDHEYTLRDSLSLNLDTGLGVGDLDSEGFGLCEDVNTLARGNGRGDPDYINISIVFSNELLFSCRS
jgi:hypothetical protein